MYQKVFQPRAMADDGHSKRSYSIKIIKVQLRRFLPVRLRTFDFNYKHDPKLLKLELSIVFRHVHIRLQHPNREKLLRPGSS